MRVALLLEVSAENPDHADSELEQVIEGLGRLGYVEVLATEEAEEGRDVEIRFSVAPPEDKNQNLLPLESRRVAHHPV